MFSAKMVVVVRIGIQQPMCLAVPEITREADSLPCVDHERSVYQYGLDGMMKGVGTDGELHESGLDIYACTRGEKSGQPATRPLLRYLLHASKMMMANRLEGSLRVEKGMELNGLAFAFAFMNLTEYVLTSN